MLLVFRDLEQQTNDAIALFGNKEARGIVVLKPYADYYADYAQKVAELLAAYPGGQLPAGETAKKDFIDLFGAILRLQNILTSFDEFAGHEILTARQSQDYRSIYLDLYAEFRKDAAAEKESINDDVVFEIELIKQVEINVEYILMVVTKHRDEHGDGDDKEIRAEIARAVDSSPTLRNKRDLIEDFVESLTVDSQVEAAWREFIAERHEAELESIIQTEGLRADEARAFVATAFRDGGVNASGTAITKVLPPVSRFSPDGSHGDKKQRVVARLGDFFDRYFGLG